MIPVYIMEPDGVRRIDAVDEQSADRIVRQCESRGLFVVADWGTEGISMEDFDSEVY